MNKNEHGFGTVEGVLVVILVALLGVGGYMVWKRNNQPATTTSTTKTSTPAAKTTIENTTYSKVPADLQAAILAETKQSTPACVKGEQIVDFNGNPEDKTVTYDSNGFAITGIGCDGGSSYLFVKQSGEWKAAAHTQMAFECSLLKSYKVPVELLKTAYKIPDPDSCRATDPSAPLETYTGQ